MSNVLPTTADPRPAARARPQTSTDGSLEPWLALGSAPRQPAPTRPAWAMRSVTLSAEEWAWLFPRVGLPTAEPATPGPARQA